MRRIYKLETAHVQSKINNQQALHLEWGRLHRLHIFFIFFFYLFYFCSTNILVIIGYLESRSLFA